jgi:hypothetical protein
MPMPWLRSVHASLPRMRLIVLILLALSCTLPAAVSSGGGTSGQLPGDDRTAIKKQPEWIADPTQGGKVKGGVLTWPAGADRDTQRLSRKTAIETLRTTFKLPDNAKVKDMDTWTDAAGATFIHLVAR